MDALLLITTATGLGALLRALRVLQASDARPLDVWVLWIALPALVLQLVPQLEPRADLLVAVAGPWVAAASALVFVPPLARAIGAPRPSVGGLVLTTMLGNTAFVGLAAVEALRGPEALPIALVADQLGSFLALSTLGLGTAAAYGGQRLSTTRVIRRMVTFPPFQALILAAILGLTGLTLPTAAQTVLQRLGSTLVPVALFTVGLRFSMGAVRDGLPLLTLGLTWRLVIGPALVLLIAWAAGASPLIRDVAVLQSGMAPMVTASILAADNDLDPELAASMVGIGLVASGLSLLFWSSLLGGLS